MESRDNADELESSPAVIGDQKAEESERTAQFTGLFREYMNGQLLVQSSMSRTVKSRERKSAETQA